VKRFASSLLAAMLVLSASSAHAETAAPPLRHLAFDLALEISTSARREGSATSPIRWAVDRRDKRGRDAPVVDRCDIVAANPTVTCWSTSRRPGRIASLL